MADVQSGASQVQGEVAEDSNAAGNPVLVGGRFDSSPRTLDDTDVGAIALAADGAVHIDDGGNTITIDGTVTAGNTAGDVAHDTADSGNPVKIGGVAKEQDGTDPGSVAEDDRTNVIVDRNGRVYVNQAHPNLWDANENASTAQTNNQLQAAPGANLSLYVTDIFISTDAEMNITLVEDTAGSPVAKAGPYYFAPNGGASTSRVSPIKISTNKDIGFTSSADGNHTITLGGYIAP